MSSIIVQIDGIPEGRCCKTGVSSCKYLKYYDGCYPYCVLFDDKSLRKEQEIGYPYRCKECKEAESAYHTMAQRKAYRSPFYQVED